jgi:CRISPR-associated protein Cas2
LTGASEEDLPVLTWVVYDISVDKTRNRIAKRCLDFGLYRVQKSVFLGDLESNRVEEIVLFSTELMNPATDSVYVFPMCRQDFERVRIVGQGFERKLVADEVVTQVI